MHFSDRLAAIIKKKDSCLMLGLDPSLKRISSVSSEQIAVSSLQERADLYEKFCLDRVHECQEYVCGVKIQMAYFEALGSVGIKAVENIIAHIRDHHEDLIIMMDAKRGDIGSTCEAYSQAFLGGSPLAGDAVTVNPYLGSDGLQPFYEFGPQKSTFILVKTSNSSSHEYQANIYADVARDVSIAGSLGDCGWSNVGAVVGATNGEAIAEAREYMPNNWILAPGIGAQGGSMSDVLSIRDEDGLGVLIPISRGILYADDPAATAREYWESQRVNK